MRACNFVPKEMRQKHQCMYWKVNWYVREKWRIYWNEVIVEENHMKNQPEWPVFVLSNHKWHIWVFIQWMVSCPLDHMNSSGLCWLMGCSLPFCLCCQLHHDASLLNPGCVIITKLSDQMLGDVKINSCLSCLLLVSGMFHVSPQMRNGLHHLYQIP